MFQLMNAVCFFLFLSSYFRTVFHVILVFLVDNSIFVLFHDILPQTWDAQVRFRLDVTCIYLSISVQVRSWVLKVPHPV